MRSCQLGIAVPKSYGLIWLLDPGCRGNSAARPAWIFGDHTWVSCRMSRVTAADSPYEVYRPQPKCGTSVADEWTYSKMENAPVYTVAFFPMGFRSCLLACSRCFSPVPWETASLCRELTLEPLHTRHQMHRPDRIARSAAAGLPVDRERPDWRGPH